MKQKSISKNYLYNLSYQLLNIIIPLITTPYLARALGPESIGIYSYTFSITTYFILFGTLGIFMYGQREIAYVQENRKKRSIVFWEIVLLKIITMAISITIFCFSFGHSQDYKLFYRIFIIELISQCIDIGWFFHGLEDFKKTVIRNSIVKVFFSISIFIFVKTPEDLWKYIILITGANLLGNVSLWLYIPRYIEKVQLKEINIVQHVKPTVMLFIPQIAVQIYTVLDKTMIGEIVNDKSEVGFYEQAQKVVRLLLTFVTSLGTVMVPRIASTFAQGDKEKLKNYMYSSFKFVYFLSFPIMTGLMLISNEFVPVFFGDGYTKVSTLINVIMPIVLFIGLSNIIGTQFLLPTKRQKEYTISVVVGAVVNFIFNLFFIRMFASIGASIATVIAELAVTLVQLYFVKKEIEFTNIIKLSIKNIIASVIMAFIVYGISLMLPLKGIYLIAIKMIIGIVTYIVTLIILRDEFLKNVISKIIDKTIQYKNKIIKSGS